MTIVEVIIALVAVVALVIGFFAHKDHISFKAEAEKDLTAAKADFAKVVADIEARLRALEGKAATPVVAPAVVTTATK